MFHSLSAKITLGYITLVVVNVAVAVFAIYRIDQLSQPIDRLLTEKYRNVQAAENMLLAISKLDLLQFAMMEQGTTNRRTVEFEAYKNDFQNWHQQAVKGIALPEEPELLDSIRIYFRGYEVSSDAMRKMLEQKLPEDSIRSVHHFTVLPYLDKTVTLCNRLKDLNEAALSAADQRAQSMAGQARNIIILFAALALVISIVASVFFIRTILRPVQQTTEMVRRIAKGNFRQMVSIDTDDEMAVLGMEFNKMTARLQEYEELNIRQILSEKRKTETVVASIPVALIVSDERRRIDLMNEQACNLPGVEVEIWQGRRMSEVIPEQMLSQMEKFEREPVLITLQKDGDDLFYFYRRVDIPGATQLHTSHIHLFQDVTSFKKLDRMKSQFMAVASHELKTPLTSINMAVDILLKEVKGKVNDAQLELLTAAKQDLVRMRQFLLQLLDLTRLESGVFPMQNDKQQAGVLIRSAVDQVRLKLEQKALSIIQTWDKNLPAIQGDSSQLQRVLINLLDNAIKHTPRSGRIVISAGQTDDKILFAVADEGEGIPEEDREIIFDKFVQVKSFESAAPGSVGLGLAICKEIVQNHGGEIWIESRFGKGSCFKFTIPVYQNEGARQNG